MKPVSQWYPRREGYHQKGVNVRNKVLMLCGILGPIVYVGAVILGGALRPDYSHVAQPVSDLIATGAPNKALLDPLFGAYNLLVLAFAVGLFQRVRAEGQNRGKLVGTVGAVVLLLEGLFGFLTLFFAEDSGPISQATTNGIMHIVLASLSALTAILALVLMGFWFRSIPNLHRYSVYTFISALVVTVAGGLAAQTVANHSSLGGLFERITIGGFIQWIFVVALVMYGAYASYSSKAVGATASS